MDVQPLSKIKKEDLIASTPSFKHEEVAQSDDQTYEILKPKISPFYEAEQVTSVPIICARLMDTIQTYVLSSAEPAELKQEYLGGKISKTKQSLRKAEKEILESKKAVSSWEWRKKLANYLFNGVSILAGSALCAAGQVGAGGSLIASGIGLSTSELLSSMGYDSKITGALSVASAMVGVFGTLGCGVHQFLSNPQVTIAALQNGPISAYAQGAAAITTFSANGFSHVATIKKNEGLTQLSQLEALHTKSDTLLRSLDQKHAGAASAVQSTAKNFSEGFKTISKAYNRYTRDAMRVLTADFPG